MAFQHIPDDVGHSSDGFKATTFISGALTGRRTFKIEKSSVHGLRLASPVNEYSWNDRVVNIARCSQQYNSCKTSHRPGSMMCLCGFCAYFLETPNTRTYKYSMYAGIGIEGIIFGFGNATAGTLGFRCSKARILALVEPKDEDMQQPGERELFDAAREKFNGVRWYPTIEEAISDWPLSSKPRYLKDLPND